MAATFDYGLYAAWTALLDLGMTFALYSTPVQLSINLSRDKGVGRRK